MEAAVLGRADFYGKQEQNSYAVYLFPLEHFHLPFLL